MAAVFDDVIFGAASENSKFFAVDDNLTSSVRIELIRNGTENYLSIKTGSIIGPTIPLDADTEYSKVGKQCFLISREDRSFFLKFPNEGAYRAFRTKLRQLTTPGKKSTFNLRTDETSAVQYFQFYGYLSQQQNMMQDYIRTSTYQRAMIDNISDFQDKVVLDVGAGSGILSFFAIQAGARKVYAIEASSMAVHCNALVRENKLEDRIIVIPGKVEEVDLPEPVDVIISEPMGYMLFNERMLETYLHAKKWLKPGGNMFPTRGDLYVAPFTDEALYMEQFSKSNFWYQHTFYGVNLACLRNEAMEEYFKQPVVDTFDVRICLAKPHKYTVDFLTADETDLHHIHIPVEFIIHQSGTIHGLAFWFDVAFIGKTKCVWLSTAPTEPLTHWYQVRCLLHRPLFVQVGQKVTGTVVLKSNDRQSYDVDVEVIVNGNRSVNTLDLKNPFFRYTGQPPQPPPGTQNQSPSDAYWNATDNNQHNSVYVNGGLVNGQVVLDAVTGQQIPAQTNLLAPVNQGSIPSVISLVTQQQQSQTSQQSQPQLALSQSQQTRTSIGAGISPSLLQQQQAGQNTIFGNPSYPVSPQFMIGDYALNQQPQQMATILLPDGSTATLQTQPVQQLNTFTKQS